MSTTRKVFNLVTHCIEDSATPVPKNSLAEVSLDLTPSSLPEYPWRKVGSDLFMLNGVNYILLIDYFSRYPEVVKPNSTTSGT